MDVVREEAFLVQDCRQSLCTGSHAHLLAVLILVHFHNSIQTFLERVAVCSEADHGENDFGSVIIGTDAEELGSVAGVDVVAAGRSCVACQDCEVRA